METYSSFDVLLVPFPFTDRTTQKKRPAVVLSGEGYYADTGQLVCAMITTGKRSQWQSDVSIEGLEAAGLPVPSKVRVKIFTLDARFVLKRLGHLSRKDESKVKRNLKGILT